MKNQLVRTYPFTRFTSRLVTLVLFAAFLVAAPYQAALAQNLGSADSFAVLGGPAVTLTGAAVTGDVGSGLPFPASAVTLTDSTVSGTVHEGDAVAVAAYADFFSLYDALAATECTDIVSLQTAYTDATLTLPPGVYCNTAAVTFTRTTLTLDAEGDPDAVWIFKIGTLGTGALTGTRLSVIMADGGQPCNVYWWVAEAATLTTSKLKGNLLAGKAASFTGGTLFGRALAKDAVTMIGTDVFGCVIDGQPPVPPVEDYCKDYSDFYNDYWNTYWYNYYKDFCKHHDKECGKHDWKDCWKHHDKDCGKHDWKDCWKHHDKDNCWNDDRNCDRDDDDDDDDEKGRKNKEKKDDKNKGNDRGKRKK